MSDAYSVVTNAFTDSTTAIAGTIAGEVTASSGAITDVFSDVAIDELKAGVMNYMRDNLPDELAEALFEQGAEAAEDAVLSERASQAVSMFGYVYGAYMVYQYIKLALTLLTACHEYEQDMGVRIATRQCIKVGDRYCAEEFLGVCYQRRRDYCCYEFSNENI